MQPPAVQPSAAAPGRAYALQPNHSPVFSGPRPQPANSLQLRDCSTLAIRPNALDPTVAFIVQPHKLSGGHDPRIRDYSNGEEFLPSDRSAFPAHPRPDAGS